MVNIDAKGKPCPMPVILAKKEMEKGQPFFFFFDNETAVGNLTRLAGAKGCTLNVINGEGEYTLEFSAPSGEVSESTEGGAYAVFFNKNTVGSGDDTLGGNLAKMMLYTLTQSDSIPSYVLLMNGGVRLACEQETADHLNALIDKGCTVMVCGTCLNFFGIAEEIKAGIVSNMYDILTAMQQVSKVITV